MRRFAGWFMGFLLISSGAFAQALFPDDGEVFRDDVLPVIHITIDADSLNAIYSNPESDHEYPATFQFSNGFIDETIENVGFRVRGNTSRSSVKKSFKVAFNSFDKTQKFYGLEKMNINGEHNDPSIIRAKIGWDICKELNIPSSRANHVQLFINGEFWGVYINVEHVDEEFADLRFGSKKGNLYKCLWPADLAYKGTDPGAYKFESGGRRAYQLKTNEVEDDYSDLAEFIDVLNNTPIASLENELAKVFNIDMYLSCIVMDVFTGNWDGPLFNKNNFYLYHNPETDLFEYIPYDLDNTLGIDWFNIDWSSRDIYNWSASWNDLPLYERILDVPGFREEFTQRFSDLLMQTVDSKELESRIWRIKAMVEPYVTDDPFYPGDYGWDINDFNNSYTGTVSTNHVKSGVLPYISKRSASAKLQFDILGISDTRLSNSYAVYPNPADDYIYLPSPQNHPVYLFSLQGKMLTSWSAPHGAEKLSVSHLAAGTYVLKQQLTKGEVVSQLLIIN